MSSIKKIQMNGKKALSIFGFKLPYSTGQNGVTKIFSAGNLHIPYHLSEKRGIPLPFPPSPASIRRAGISGTKMLHYRMKEKWNDPAAVKQRLTELYEQRLGRTPDLDNPERFTEKINHLKLSLHDPQITRCCDKYALKEYISEVLGEEYSVPTLAAWNAADKMDLSSLPNEFVLKVNWSSGYNLFIRDKSALSLREQERIRAQIEVWLRREANSYYDSFNWGYRDIAPVVFAEPYLSEASTASEYKVFCFHGNPEFTLIESNTPSGVWMRTCVDNNANPLPFTFGSQQHTGNVQIPEDFHTMLDMAQKLSAPFPFVRVDFLGEPGKRMVGEMTFYSGGGFSVITPDEWDKKLGAML